MNQPSRGALRLRFWHGRPGGTGMGQGCLQLLAAAWMPAGSFILGAGLGAALTLLALPAWRWAAPLLAAGGLAAAWWAGRHTPLAAAREGLGAAHHRLEERNRQLQMLLQASRAMAGDLDLQRVLAAVIRQVTDLSGFHKACVVLGPDRDGAFRIGAAAGLAPEDLQAYAAILRGQMRFSAPSGLAWQTRQPVVVEDVATDFRLIPLRPFYARAQIRALIAVPMVVQERFIGTLTVYGERPASFDTARVSLLAALAGQAALALENARLYTLTAENRLRLDRAVEFLESISGTLTQSQVGVVPLLRRVAEAAARLFAPATVYLFVQADAARGDVPQVLTESLGVDPVLAARWREELMNAADPGRVEVPWPAALGLPIILDGCRLGHFEIYLAGEERRVEAEECRILLAFVHLTAGALANAGLVQELRQAVAGAERAYMGALEALTRALELRDYETEGHSRRVVQYTLALAQKLGVPEGQLVPMMRGALLHDIGKIGIPDQILRKPGPLTPEEWETMKTHTRIGYEMLCHIDFLRDAAPIILHHHERFDGSGYPDGLIGQVIPLGARIFAVADAYDALTSNRPYRRGRSHQAAVEEIVRCSGTHFDPQVVAALLELPEAELSRIRTGGALPPP